ncbi:MAG: hypothetical protein IKE01_01475 [Clostridia bacterium]|nr:hypothetical protein [Clostridia bacterium]
MYAVKKLSDKYIEQVLNTIGKFITFKIIFRATYNLMEFKIFNMFFYNWTIRYHSKSFNVI